MPDLDRPLAGAAIDFAVDDQPAADAGTDRHVEDRRQALAGAEARLGQGGAVGVVAEHGRQAEGLLGPVGEREAFPAADLVRFEDGPRRVVDRAAEADADGPQL